MCHSSWFAHSSTTRCGSTVRYIKLHTPGFKAFHKTLAAHASNAGAWDCCSWFESLAEGSAELLLLLPLALCDRRCRDPSSSSRVEVWWKCSPSTAAAETYGANNAKQQQQAPRDVDQQEPQLCLTQHHSRSGSVPSVPHQLQQ